MFALDLLIQFSGHLLIFLFIPCYVACVSQDSYAILKEQVVIQKTAIARAVKSFDIEIACHKLDELLDLSTVLEVDYVAIGRILSFPISFIIYVL